jgi:hypothetical protein
LRSRELSKEGVLRDIAEVFFEEKELYCGAKLRVEEICGESKLETEFDREDEGSFSRFASSFSMLSFFSRSNSLWGVSNSFVECLTFESLILPCIQHYPH